VASVVKPSPVACLSKNEFFCSGKIRVFARRSLAAHALQQAAGSQAQRDGGSCVVVGGDVKRHVPGTAESAN
jgi:hypothetical protein